MNAVIAKKMNDWFLIREFKKYYEQFSKDKRKRRQ